MLKVILFIFISLNFDLIAGDNSQQGATRNPFNAVISQKRILAAMECSRTGNKGRSCLLKVESDGVYEIKLDAETRLTATLALVNPNTNLNIAFTSDSNPPLTPKISIYKDKQKQDIRNNPSLTNIVIQKSVIEDYNGGIVRLEVFSPKSVKLALKMSFDVEDDDSNDISLLIIILPIVGGMLIFLGLVCWCRFVNMRRQRMRRFIQRQPEQNGLLTEHREIEMEGNGRLTEQNLNERFPEAKRDVIKSSFPQPACSVCLEEFQQDVPCRQLYCQHIFHSECIKLWFLNQLKKGHANCPNCNKSMLKKMELGPVQE